MPAYKDARVIKPVHKVIHRIGDADKWVEFWWEGVQKPDSECCHDCTKWYMFHEHFDDELYHHVLNRGYVGLAVAWEGEEITKVYVPTLVDFGPIAGW